MVRKSVAETRNTGRKKPKSIGNIGNTENGVKKSAGKVVNEPEKIFFGKVIGEIVDYIVKNYNETKERLAKLKPSELVKNRGIETVLSNFSTGLTYYYLHYYSDKIEGKIPNKFEDKKCLTMFEGVDTQQNSFKNLLLKIFNRLSISPAQVIKGYELSKEQKREYYLEKKKRELEERFTENLTKVFSFIETYLGDEPEMQGIDINNLFTIKNLYCIIKLHLSGKLKGLLDEDVVLNIIKIISWNIYLSAIVDGLDIERLKNTTNSLINDIVNIDWFLKNIEEMQIDNVFTIFVEYLFEINDFNNSFPSNEKIFKKFAKSKLGLDISSTSYDKYIESGIEAKITLADSIKRKEFLLKIIFSNINLFCNGGVFSNIELFDLIELIEEKRFELIIKIFNKGLSANQLKFIIQNKVEAEILPFSNLNIDFIIYLTELGVELQDIFTIGNPELEYLRGLKINSKEKFYYYLTIVAENPQNYINVILNKELKRELTAVIDELSDMELSEEDKKGFQELKNILSRENFLELDNELLKKEILRIYEIYGIQNILLGRTVNLETNKDPSSIVPKELLELIKELEFEDDILSIVYRILEILNNDDEKWIFVSWLYESEKLDFEDIRKVLSIISLLKDLHIDNFGIGNIIKNLKRINIEYLRWLDKEIKTNKLRFNYQGHILTYLSDLNEDKLRQSMKELFSEQEEINNNELDNILAKVLNSNNDIGKNNFGKSVQSVLDKIFTRLHPSNVTSTKNNKGFGSGSGTFMDNVRQIIFGELLKKPSENYVEYLTRLQNISLEQLFKGMRTSDINGSFFLSYITTLPCYGKSFPVFYFLEIFKTDVIGVINGTGKTDLEGLGKYYEGVIQEETSKLKKSLNI